MTNQTYVTLSKCEGSLVRCAPLSNREILHSLRSFRMTTGLQFLHIIIFVFILWFLIFNFSYASEPSLGKSDREQIGKALAIQGITEKELSFEKKWALDSIFRLPVVSDLMDNPLKTPDYLDNAVVKIDNIFTAKSQSGLASLLSYITPELDIKLSQKEIKSLNSEIDKQSKEVIKDYQSLPAELSQPVALILSGYAVGDRYLKQAINGISDYDLHRILMTAPVLWSDEDDTLVPSEKGTLHREFGLAIDTTVKFEIDTLLAISQKVNRKAMAMASYAVVIATDKAKIYLANLKDITVEKPNLVNDIKGNILFYEETRWGRVVIGSKDDNIYNGDYNLIIDLGGDDTYKGRTGSGIGILSHPFSVAIDLKGNDFYDCPNKFFNIGAGLFGCGLVLDYEGNDFYNSYSNCLGAGFFGTGALIDYAGDDIYTGGYFCQGAGIFGAGALIDLAGNDSYRGYEYCQAFSSTWGYGLLSDLAGNDIYYAGGKYLHKPLLPDDFRCLSQGFSIGFRPVASGGIALLYDKAGQDYYNGGVFAQGTSYWYALGMLYDGEGNDFYNATEYAQGAGIHLSVGILIDRLGDDQYFSRLGPAQGEGHDFAVGILLDKRGNDSYLTSGGQGIGLTNSFGLFIDNEGNDIYSTKEKTFGQGMANWARGFGGIGVFLDLQGEDRYPRESPAENTTSWTQTVYGMGIDELGKARDVEAEIQEEPDTLKLKIDSIEYVFKEAALWEVGSAKKRVKAGRAELLNRGIEAINYIRDNKMNTKDGLELRAIEELAKAIIDTAYTDSVNKTRVKSMYYQSLYDKDRWTRSNAAYLLGKLKQKDAIDSLMLAFNQSRIRARSVIGAFEEIADSSVVEMIIPYLKDKEEPTRIASARALAKIKDARAVSELFNAIHDKFFTVRIAAETALVAIGEPSLNYLLTKSNDPQIIGIIAELGIKLDSIIKPDQKTLIQNIIIPYLDDKDASIRLKAVNALVKFKDETIKTLLQEKMILEKNEFVLSKYKEVVK